MDISSPNAHVVLAAIKRFILRPRKDDNGREMYQKAKAKARAKREKLFFS